MSEYNAGSIEASADINLDPFIAGIRQAMQMGRDLGAQKFTATAEVDTLQANRKLAQMQILIRRINEEGVHPDVRVDTTEAEAALARLRAEQARTDQQLRAGSTQRQAQVKQETKNIGLLRTAIEFLGPELVPLAGGLTAIAAGAANLGVAGILAFKGISAEIKAGTPLGVTYSGMLGVLKADVVTLQTTAAKGLLPGADKAVAKLGMAMPALNADMRVTSAQLGDIVQHLAGGVAGGFSTFGPLMREAGGYVDHLAASFEHWATGPGGASFAKTLATDLQHVIPFLRETGQLVEHVLGAINPLGLTMLDTLTRLESVLNKLSPTELQALTVAYIAYRSAVAVTAGINAAAGAWGRLAGAEVAAGAAGGAGGAGARTGLAAILSRYALPAVAVEATLLGGGTIASRLGNATSTNNTSRAVGQVGLAARDLGQFNFSGAWSNLFGSASNRNNRTAQDTIDYRNAAKALTYGSGQYVGRMPGTVTQSPTGAGSQLRMTPGEGLNYNARTGLPYSVGQLLNSFRNQYRSQVAAPRMGIQSALYKSTDGSTNYTAVANSYTAANGALQKLVGTQGKWLQQGGAAIETYRGVTVTQGTWDAALKATNGDHVRAQALVEGNIQAYQRTVAVLKQNQTEQARLNTDVTQAETKYKLTGAQVQLYGRVLGITGRQLATGKVTQADWLHQVGQVNSFVNNASASTAAWVAALQTFNSTADTSASRAALIGATLVAMNGDNLNYANTMAQAAGANQDLVNAFTAQARATINLKTGTIDFKNAAALPLTTALQGLQTAAMNAASATYQHQRATESGKKAATDAFEVYKNDTRGALEAEASQLGLTAGQAKKLADQYFGLSNQKDIKKNIQMIGADKTDRILSKILTALRNLSGGYTVHVNDSEIRAAADQAARLQRNLHQGEGSGSQYKASGGWIYGRGTGTSDSNPAMLSKGEFVVNAHSASRHAEILQAINSGGLPGFTRGTPGQGGFDGVTGGSGSSSSGSGSGGSGSSKGPTLKEINAMVAMIRRNLTAMSSLASASASRITTVEQKILTAAKTAAKWGVIPNGLVKQFRADNAALNAEIKVRDQIQRRLDIDNAHVKAIRANMRAEQSRVAGAVTGGFDIGTSGNGYKAGIRSSLDQQVKDALKFQKDLKIAEKMGLDPRLLRQIEEEGPETAGANLAALIAGGKSYIAGINRQENRLAKIGRQIGGGAARSEYGEKLDKWEAKAAVQRDKMHDVMKGVREDVHHLREDVHTLDRKLLVARRKGS